MPAIALVWFCAFGLLLAGEPSAFAGLRSVTGADIFEVTSSNRHYPGIMFGGWGPHLRAPMRNSRDELWFVTDSGPDVLHDDQIIYHEFDGKRWSEIARLKQMSGIQQNVASVMCGDIIYSYGISIREPLYVEECKFDTKWKKVLSCAAVEIGAKPLVLPASCNYVGAAVGPDAQKIVWWTTVGVNGAEGKWSYIYQQSNCWIGPVVSPLSGYNDFGYVFASSSSPGALAIAGQLFKGAYPVGSYAVGCAEFRLGEKLEYAKNFYALNTNAPNAGRSAADICVVNAGTHVIAEAQGKLAYYFKPSGKKWSQCDSPICVLPNVHRARFCQTARNFYLITGSADGSALNIRSVAKSKSAAAVDWSKIAPVPVAVPASLFAEPSAIYVESRNYQTHDVERLNFSIVGHYPEADGKILSIQFPQ